MAWVTALQSLQVDVNTGLAASARAQQWRQATAICTLALSSLRADAATCSAIIRCFQRQELWQGAFGWLTRFVNLGIELNGFVYNALLTASRWSLCLCTMNDFAREHIQKDIISFNSAITACSRSRRWTEALRLFKTCPERSLQASVVSVGAAVSACAGEHWSATLTLVKTQNTRSTTLYNSLIASCIGGGSWQKVACLMLDPLPGVQPDLITLNTWMAGSGPWPAALSMAGSSWDVITYNSAIQRVPWCEALQLTQELHQELLRPNSFTGVPDLPWARALQGRHNVAITCCAKMRQWVWALELGQQPDEVTFGVRLNACEQRWKLASVFFSLQTLQPLDWTYLRLGTGMPFNLYSIQVITCNTCNFSNAFFFFFFNTSVTSIKIQYISIYTLFLFPLRLNHVTANTLLRVLASSGMWSRANAFFRSMAQKSLDPDPLSCAAASSAASQASLWMPSLSYLQGRGVTVTNIAITACSVERWQASLLIFERLGALAVQGTGITYNAAVSALAQAALWRDALSLSGATPQAFGFTAAIAACEKAQWKEGRHMRDLRLRRYLT